MLFSDLRRVVLGMAIAGLIIGQSSLMAQHHGGGNHGGGHHGGGNHSGHHGGGHYGGGHYGHSGHNHFGGGYGYGGGGFYGGNLYSGSGFSISIGGGYPYGHSGFGYGSLGYGGLSDSYRYPATGYSPIYRGSTYYGSAYPGFSYDTAPAYGGSTYPYGTAIEPQYGVPGYSSEFQHQPVAEPPYSVGRVDPSSSDLRPGMVLPDGSTVVSIGPLDGPTVQAVPESTTSEDRAADSSDSDIESIPLPELDEASNRVPTEAPSR
ncbi:hypothetical protein SH528x_002620 [Novipirellula sp. SH528]|uniref:hypothetical protein n=1 Tax=Novipirellula sp. SH528 TaxID=3454466 RepID=UPI003FA17054